MVDKTKIISIKVTQQCKANLVQCGIAQPNVQYGENVLARICDLPRHSSIAIDIQCDYCGEIVTIDIARINQLKGNTYCCPHCIKRYKKIRNADGKTEYVYAPYRDKEWLHNEYVVKNRSGEEIAKECGINHRTLREWIHTFNLTQKLGAVTDRLPIDEIVRLYTVNKIGSAEIGRRYGVTGNTIIALLRKNGISIPSQSEWSKHWLYERDGIQKQKDMQTFERRMESSCRQRGISVDEFDGFSHSENQLIRNQSDYRSWRNAVFTRDNFTCQKCGHRGGTLHAHHIENFASRPDLRVDLSNGITLCEKCHSIKYPNSFHSIYGEHNNNAAQLNEFLCRE